MTSNGGGNLVRCLVVNGEPEQSIAQLTSTEHADGKLIVLSGMNFLANQNTAWIRIVWREEKL
jgi:hypothetical protein